MSVQPSQLEQKLIERIETLLGLRFVHFDFVTGGYTPAERWLCESSSGERVFVKVGTTPLTATFLRSEARIYQSFRAASMPDFLGWEDHPQRPLLAIEDLSACHWPPPWRQGDVERILGALSELHQQKANLPHRDPSADRGWRNVAANPGPFLSLDLVEPDWLDRVLPGLIEAEAAFETEGDSPVHLDVRSDNLCLSPDRVYLVDWNHACLANPRLDVAFWLPSLAFEGGPQPDEILPDAPDAAAWVSGFFASRAGEPIIPDAPFVRQVQKEQLQTALPWAVRALGLPAIS